MKTANLDQDRSLGVTRGHLGVLRAGSSGITVTDGTTEVDDVTDLQFTGGLVTDGTDGLATVTLGLASQHLTSITPTQLAANTNNWNPTGLATADIIRASTDASRDLTGIVAPTTERLMVLENVGAFDLVLKHDVTSTAANRFYCSNDTDLTLQKDTTAILVYDLTSARWRAIGGGGGSTFATPAIVLGTAAAAGAATTVIRSDSTILAFDATGPAAVGTQAVGAATVAARRDHVHATGAGTPSTQALGDAAATGSGPAAAMTDHKHAMPTAAVTTSGLTQTTARLLGRTTASTGAIEEITVGAGLSLASGALTASGTGPSAIAYSSGDITTTTSLADVTGCTMSLTPGTYIIAGNADTLTNNAANDRTFELHLDSGGVDQTNYGILVALALVNDRVPVTQLWRLVLAATTTVKLRAKHSGGTLGDFTVKAQSVITAWGAGTGVASDTIWDAAGDLVVGSGADTAVRLAIGAAGGHVSRINGVVAWDSGTSMPTAATGDRYWRTDLGMEFYYDGTRWVTTQLYNHQIGWIGEAAPVFPESAAQTPFRMLVPLGNAYNVWLEDMIWMSRVVTTNNGTNYWTVQLAKLTIAAASTQIVIANTSADTAGQFPIHTTAIDALLGTAHAFMDINTAKVGAPGNLTTLSVGLTYRLVAT